MSKLATLLVTSTILLSGCSVPDIVVNSDGSVNYTNYEKFPDVEYENGKVEYQNVCYGSSKDHKEGKVVFMAKPTPKLIETEKLKIEDKFLEGGNYRLRLYEIGDVWVEKGAYEKAKVGSPVKIQSKVIERGNKLNPSKQKTKLGQPDTCTHFEK